MRASRRESGNSLGARDDGSRRSLSSFHADTSSASSVVQIRFQRCFHSRCTWRSCHHRRELLRPREKCSPGSDTGDVRASACGLSKGILGRRSVEEANRFGARAVPSSWPGASGCARRSPLLRNVPLTKHRRENRGCRETGRNGRGPASQRISARLAENRLTRIAPKRLPGVLAAETTRFDQSASLAAAQRAPTASWRRALARSTKILTPPRRPMASWTAGPSRRDSGAVDHLPIDTPSFFRSFNRPPICLGCTRLTSSSELENKTLRKRMVIVLPLERVTSEVHPYSVPSPNSAAAGFTSWLLPLSAPTWNTISTSADTSPGMRSLSSRLA